MYYRIFLSFLLLTLSFHYSHPAHAQNTQNSNEFIFAFDHKLLRSLISKNKPALEQTLRPIVPSPRARMLATQTVTRLKRQMVRRVARGKQKHLRLIDAKLLTVRPGRKVKQTKRVEYAVNSGLIKYMEPNISLRTFATPNDPEYSRLWGLKSASGIDIAATTGWNIRTDSAAAVVAVLDTGIDPEHPDLRANMWRNQREIPDNQIDDDKNGYIDDVYGCDFITYEKGSNAYCGAKPFHENDHGTHVAGTIGARGNNGIGISGVAWKTQLMSLAFLGKDGSGKLSDMIEALTYAVEMKRAYNRSNGQRGANIRVLNASLGHTGGFLQSEYDAIKELGKADILLVAAAGNGGWLGIGYNNDSSPTYPASYDLDNLISVAAIGQSGNLTRFSNFGPNSVHVAAPGESIYSTVLKNNYRSMSGTSMAAPHVSGVAALIAGHKPSMPAWMIKQVIIASVKDGSANKSLAGLSGKILSGGLLDLREALLLSQTNLDRPRITGQPKDQKSYVKGKVSLTVNAIGEAPMTYEWHKNGRAYQTTKSGTLSFSSLSISDAGTYTCTVSNRHGKVTSSAAKLHVEQARQGDLNNDGVVNIFDMMVLMSNLGKSGKDLPGDLNKDGVVDLKDLHMLIVIMGQPQ